MRLSPSTGKEDCRIIDFVDSTSRIDGVVSVPTLFGLNPGEIDIDGERYCFFSVLPFIILATIDETTESLEKQAEAFEAMRTKSVSPFVPDPISILYTDEDDPFTAQKPGHINALSKFAWVSCGDEIFVIELLAKGFIRIEHPGM